jgi:hypothetical protein
MGLIEPLIKNKFVYKPQNPTIKIKFLFHENQE